MRLFLKISFSFSLIFLSGPLFAKSFPEKPAGYAIASAHPLATEAGLKILAEGGNAFDAAVAVGAALSVVEPYHLGLGGGSMWLLHEAKNHQNIFLDAREKAPLAAHPKMFQASDGSVIPDLSLIGGLACAIPGHPAALVYVAKHYGRLPLAKTLAPAIALAEEGFIVDKQYVINSRRVGILPSLQKYPDTAAIFLKNGQPYAIGDRLIQKDLAYTLKQLASLGHDGFYKGVIAKQLVQGVNKAGGIWSLQDLAQYQVIPREPLVGAFHNMLVVSAPLPSAGGIGLLTMLNILSFYPLLDLPQLEQVHLIAESMRLAYWQRDKLGDPDFIKSPVSYLLSAANAKALKNLIPKDKALESLQLLSSKTEPAKETHTSHMAILDAEGNRVSTTMSINYYFGSSVVAAGTGVLLNNEMDDFSTKPGEKNVFGVVGSKANEIAPGKRPLSSMTPTFLETPGRVAIVGVPGGSRIPTMVLLASLAFYDHLGAISMVSKMRFHHQFLPDVLQFEPDSFSPDFQDKLRQMGYQLMPLPQYYGDMQAITWDKESQLITAASDPRGIGLGAVVNW